MSEKQFNLDTVEHAAETPDTELPWACLLYTSDAADE